jgi:DNA-binding transcriptional regulator YiaG
MPNLNLVFRKEVSRIVSRETRAVVDPLIAKLLALKKEIAEQKQMLKVLVENAGLQSKIVSVKDKIKPLPEEALGKVRIGGKLIKKMRTKLKMTRAVLAKMLGVSQNSVYQWESGKVRPRKQVIARLVALRNMGKKDIKKIVVQLKDQAPKKQSAGKKRSATTKRAPVAKQPEQTPAPE